MVATAGGKPQRLTSMKGNDSEPAWSPDGRWIAFVAKRGDDKQSQLYVIAHERRRGDPRQRRADRRVRAEVVPRFAAHRLHHVASGRTSPTGRRPRRSMNEREDSKMTAMAWDRPPVTHWDHFIDDRSPASYSRSARGRHAHARSRWRRASHCRDARDGADPTTSRRTATRWPSSPNSDAAGIDENHDVYVVAAAGGAARNLTADNPAGDERPRYSPDGRYLAYTQAGDQGLLWRHAAADAPGPQERRANRRLAADWDRSVSGLAWAPDSKSLYASIDDARHAAHLPLRRREGHAARGDGGLELLRARDRRQARDARRAAPVVQRAADAGRRRRPRTAPQPSSPTTTTRSSRRPPSARSRA